uniref:histidinol-phosphate transaminase n=1 Tax=Chrysotila carterae TaxID=13221 RepID=A0A7S4BZX8_CHRCT
MPDSAFLHELCDFAEELAKAAAAEILPFWRKPIVVESKIDSERPVEESPVTIADRNAEKAMRALIEARYPTHGVIGEELGSVREGAEYCWVLDPIDGTKSFITGKPLFGTLIGLCFHGAPIVGVIDQCVLKERWVGVVGGGTKLNGTLVHTRSASTELKETMLYATTPEMFSSGFETERFDAVRASVKRTLYGCDCYAYGLLAAGFGADLVVEADLCVYDYAALVPVVLGAGGLMTDWSGQPLTLQRHGFSHGRVVAAANATIHAAALELLATPSENGSNGKPHSVLKPHLRELAPYKPPLDGRSPDQHILLDFNERTIPVPEHIPAAITKHMATKGLQCYPAYGDLNENIAEYAGVPADQCMFTNGSDQGIDLIIRACCASGTEAIIPAPTFAMYEQAALTENLVIKRPFFTRERGFPTDEVIAAVNDKTSLIVLSNPNNPTGTPIAKADMVKIALFAPNCAILIDECYYEFMPPESSMKNELARLPNVFVTRTFSKTWGIPSLRLGYLLSAEHNIRALCSVRGPYDVNQLSVVAVRAAMSAPQYVFDYVKEHNTIARPAFERYLDKKGIVYWPSSANYIFCYFPEPMELEAKLRARGILVRPKKDADGVTGLRVSIGTAAQTDQLISTLEQLLP